MMSNKMLQLDPMLPVDVVGKGKGFAFALIDYSQEHHLMFVVALDDSGEIWCVPNMLVRAQKNMSLGRMVMKSNQAKES